MIDLTGQQFGRLKVIEQAGQNKWRQSLWLCECICGNTKIITVCDLRSSTKNGKTQCLSLFAEEHGISRRTLQNRLDMYHWSTEKALTTPVRKKVESNYKTKI